MELISGPLRSGVSMIVIDHNYAHLFALCDRLNVIQQGEVTVDAAVADTSIEELTELHGQRLPPPASGRPGSSGGDHGLRAGGLRAFRQQVVLDHARHLGVSNKVPLLVSPAELTRQSMRPWAATTSSTLPRA